MSKESNDIERLIIAAIKAHRDQHRWYGNTAACSGGIGGAMMTQHCAVTCPYHDKHEQEIEAWENVERAFFARRDGDPDWARFLPEGL